jgi:hypothetical protein
MTRAAAAAATIALLLAGCGGSTYTPPPVAKPPRIPPVLAHAWAAQADAVAQALSAGDGCTAVQHANELRDAVAAGEAQVPRRLRATLLAAVDTLPERITCNPPAPQPPHDHGKHKDQHKDQHKDHGKHGKGDH